MDSVRSNNLSLKYHRFSSPGCKDIKIRKFNFVAKTQFLYAKIFLGANNKVKDGKSSDIE